MPCSDSIPFSLLPSRSLFVLLALPQATWSSHNSISHFVAGRCEKYGLTVHLLGNLCVYKERAKERERQRGRESEWVCVSGCELPDCVAMCVECAHGMRRMRLGVPYIIQFAQRPSGIVA